MIAGIGKRSRRTLWTQIGCWGLAVCFWSSGMTRATADEDPFMDLSFPGSETNNTVITSTRVSFDQQKRAAVFRENVMVSDPQVKISADRLTVLFSDDNKVMAIEAEGQVVIWQGDKQATGEKVRYEVSAFKFVLSGHATVQNGRDTLAAETVTFWRNSNRILCEPNARLIIRSEQDVFSDGLKKE